MKNESLSQKTNAFLLDLSHNGGTNNIFVGPVNMSPHAWNLCFSERKAGGKEGDKQREK